MLVLIVFREEELRILRGEQDVDENAIDEDVFDSGRDVSKNI